MRRLPKHSFLQRLGLILLSLAAVFPAVGLPTPAAAQEAGTYQVECGDDWLRIEASGADLRRLLEEIASRCRIEISMDPTIGDRASINLRKQPLEKGLGLLLKNHDHFFVYEKRRLPGAPARIQLSRVVVIGGRDSGSGGGSRPSRGVSPAPVQRPPVTLPGPVPRGSREADDSPTPRGSREVEESPAEGEEGAAEPEDGGPGDKPPEIRKKELQEIRESLSEAVKRLEESGEEPPENMTEALRQINEDILKAPSGPPSE